MESSPFLKECEPKRHIFLCWEDNNSLSLTMQFSSGSGFPVKYCSNISFIASAYSACQVQNETLLWAFCNMETLGLFQKQYKHRIFFNTEFVANHYYFMDMLLLWWNTGVGYYRTFVYKVHAFRLLTEGLWHPTAVISKIKFPVRCATEIYASELHQSLTCYSWLYVCVCTK